MSGASEWRVSLHGGHSENYCDHAEGKLRDLLAAAVRFGYVTFGVSEHVPRTRTDLLYPEERELGWTVQRLEENFARYASDIQDLAREFGGALTVLRGFEAEVVPTATYADQVRAYRSMAALNGERAFDYFVGSVHYVDETQIDGSAEEYLRAVEWCGGVEALAVRYYQTVAEMCATLRPDVVGHLDLVRKLAARAGFEVADVETEPARRAAAGALEAVRQAGAILDLNTAGWRKGLEDPYPAPWLVKLGAGMGIPFCFGDDSHRPADVGAGIDRARQYLLSLGVAAVTVLVREGAAVARKEIPL